MMVFVEKLMNGKNAVVKSARNITKKAWYDDFANKNTREEK